MSKNKENNAKRDDIKITKGSIIARITESLNKKGEIKGENKKETKNLRAMCTHHRLSKKGNKKPTVWNDGNGVCTCEACSHKFHTKLRSREDIDKVVAMVMDPIDQAKFMAESADLGKDTLQYLAELSVMLQKFPKTYSNIKHAVEKSDHVKKKKHGNKGGNTGSGSESMGGWR